METMTYTGELVVTTCWCGIKHAVPRSLYKHQERQIAAKRLNVMSIFCPLGHKWVQSGKSEAQKLREQLTASEQRMQREQQRHDQTKAELRETENRRRAEKGAKTRIKNRVANGVCPCCKRTFQNLAQHMHQQHPKFAETD